MLKKKKPSKKKKSLAKRKSEGKAVKRQSARNKSTGSRRKAIAGRKTPSVRLFAAAASVATESLTSAEAQDICVDNTPFPEAFTGPDQQLQELGVIGPNETADHKTGIIKDLKKKHLSIDANDITSGPGIAVRTCRDSVITNAK